MECATRINFHVEESEDITLYQLHEGNVYGVQEKIGKCVAQMWIFSSLLVYKISREGLNQAEIGRVTRTIHHINLGLFKTLKRLRTWFTGMMRIIVHNKFISHLVLQGYHIIATLSGD